jgi:hypothetical protein
VHPAVFEIQLLKNSSEKKLFTSLILSIILLNIVKNAPPTRKIIGNELEVYRVIQFGIRGPTSFLF